MNPDGSGQVDISNTTGGELNPTWSPDGTKIVFSANGGGTTTDIYTMHSDGSSVTRSRRPVRTTRRTLPGLRTANRSRSTVTTSAPRTIILMYTDGSNPYGPDGRRHAGLAIGPDADTDPHTYPYPRRHLPRQPGHDHQNLGARLSITGHLRE